MKCEICKREAKPEELYENKTCKDIQKCYEAFRLIDEARVAARDAGAH